VLTPRFDLVNIKFRFDVRQEVFQIHLRHGRIVFFVVGAGDEIAEGVGGDGDSFAGRGRKLQAGNRVCRVGGLQTRPEQGCGCGRRGLRQEMSSCDGRQSGDSLAESAWQTRVKRAALL